MSKFAKRMRKNILSLRISNGTVHDKLKAALQVMELEYQDSKNQIFANAMSKPRSCNAIRRCNSPWCPICANPKSSKAKRKASTTIQSAPWETVKPTTNTKPTEYRVRGGQRMVEAFDELPSIVCHPITINMFLVAVNGCLNQISRKARRRMLRLLKKLTKGAICRGKFDIALMYLDELEFDLPDNEWPTGIDPKSPPHELYAMFHFHGVIFDPYLARRELREIIAHEFSGAKRVCVRRAKGTTVLDDGTMCGGLQGYLEYASMEKREISFGMDSADAVVKLVQIDSTWKRANRNFSFGKSISESGINISRSRIAVLLRQQHLDDVKADNGKSIPAEQFIVQWLTFADEYLECVKRARTNSISMRHVCNFLYALHSNWFGSDIFHQIDFITYFKRKKPELAKLLFERVPNQI